MLGDRTVTAGATGGPRTSRGADGLSVGAVAGRLGVAPGTLRSWGRRYGLLPAGRTPGGHRRYTADDVARLTAMQDLVGAGVAPARAAQQVIAGTPSPADEVAPTGPAPADRDRSRRRPGGPGGRVLAVPSGSPEVRGLARAASRLDVDAVTGLLGDLLAERGAVRTWDEALRPVLVAAGLRWARTGDGVDIEHVLSEATTEALRAYRACQMRPVPGRPVLVASAPEDLHVLPVHVVATALAERRVPARVLGPRVPGDALAAAVRRTGASAVFVWRQLATSPELNIAALPRTRPPLTVVVGGPGWATVDLPARVHRSRDLRDAVRTLAASPR